MFEQLHEGDVIECQNEDGSIVRFIVTSVDPVTGDHGRLIMDPETSDAG